MCVPVAACPTPLPPHAAPGCLTAAPPRRQSSQPSAWRCSTLCLITTSVSLYIQTPWQPSTPYRRNTDNTQLTRNIHTTAQAMTDTGRTVTLNWVPSHVGISGNEKADTLAGQAAQLPQVSLEVPRSLRQLRGIMRRRVETRRLGVPRAPQADTSASVRWLGEVSAAASTYPPSTQPTTRCEVVAARIRLGYPYGWQIGIVTQEGNKDCRSCGAENSHKLEHYLRDCVRVSHLRQQCPVPSPSLADLPAHFLNILPQTLKDCPSFCDTKS